MTDSLQRLRQLAVQGGSSAYSDSDRESLQHEAREIFAHITKIGSNTEFNGQACFRKTSAASAATRTGAR